MEHLQSALRAAQTTGDLKEQLTTIARQLSYFGYLTYDTVVWVGTLGATHDQHDICCCPGQRYQIYHPEAGNSPEGSKPL